MPEKQPPTLEQQINEQIERNRSFERSAEGALERIGSTTLPWEIRMAVRDAEFDFVDAPPGLGDNWGIQRLYAGLEERRRFLATHHPVNKTNESSARKAIGLEVEPWRDTPIITPQDRTEIMRRAVERGMSAPAMIDLVKKTEKNALERVPIVLNEFSRSRSELVRTRKIYYLYWNYKNAASGQEVGELYLQNKLVSLPRPKDFALMLSPTETPSYFMTKDQVSLADPADASKKIPVPDYPKEDEVGAFLENEGRSKENEPTGETTEKEARLLYAVALSEKPERLMQWKLLTEQGELFKLYAEAGVNRAYLILKEKGIDYIDPDEKAKMQTVLNGLTLDQKQAIKDTWWKNLGFKGEADGMAEMGDPEKLIPSKARRGDPTSDSAFYMESGFDRGAEMAKINSTLDLLKRSWQDLSPINNLSLVDQSKVRDRIEKLTDELRKLSIREDNKEYNRGGNKNNKVLVTVFGSLQTERELQLRKGPAEFGCIWSKPQMAGDKEKIMEKVLSKYVHGDLLAYENAKLIVDMFGFTAKWGYYARDFDPDQDYLKQWAVDVEAWPYTSEFQNILAWPWHQRYKVEAGGPDGSRARLGPLMTDYLSAYSSPELNPKDEPMVDGNGNPMFVIIDKSGALRIGRADEGVALCDVSFTLLEHWERGETLSKTQLWDNVIEDPFRRFLLRSFFAEGKTALGPGGNALLDTWKKQDWRLDDLLSNKFWDDYKLARRVALREELFNEDIWIDVARPINEIYERLAVETASRLKAVATTADRQKVMGEEVVIKINGIEEKDPVKRSGLYVWWKERRKMEIFDYSDQMFWNGVMSTSSAGGWSVELLSKRIGEFKADSPELVLRNMAIKAKSHGINIFGKWSPKKENMWPVMTEAYKVFFPGK